MAIQEQNIKFLSLFKEFLTLFKNILVVCVGNICRSPMAEGLLIKALTNTNKTDLKVYSAGLSALIDHSPDPKACQLLMNENVNISHYRAKQLDKEMIRQSDLILVMEKCHKTAIENIDPSARGKIYRLGEWGKYDIADPYQQDMAAFKKALHDIKLGITQWITKL